MFPLRPLPDIAISAEDHRRLLLLAETVTASLPYVAFYLDRELQRAAICRSWEPAGLSMGMQVRFRIGDDPERAGRLTYPEATVEGSGDIGILTPLGAALIGMHPGQSIDWLEDGQLHTLTVTGGSWPTDG